MSGIVRNFSFTLVLACTALVLLAGCGGPSYEGDPRAAVSGTVTLDGSPLPYGSILFMGEGNRMASSVIQDGNYSIPEANGPNLGEYTVQITGYAEAPPTASEEDEQDEDFDPDAQSAGKQIVPAKYNTASTLKVTIAAGENTHDFAMTSGE